MEDSQGDKRFNHLLQPIRDLAQNWNIDVAKDLEEYLDELDAVNISFDGGKTSLNFAQAALVIQGSAIIYSRKVEYLYSLIYQTLDMITTQAKKKKRGHAAEDPEADALADEAEEEFLMLDDIITEGRPSQIDLAERGGEDVAATAALAAGFSAAPSASSRSSGTAASPGMAAAAAKRASSALFAKTPLSLLSASRLDRRGGGFRISSCAISPSGALLLHSAPRSLLGMAGEDGCDGDDDAGAAASAYAAGGDHAALGEGALAFRSMVPPTPFWGGVGGGRFVATGSKPHVTAGAGATPHRLLHRSLLDLSHMSLPDVTLMGGGLGLGPCESSGHTPMSAGGDGEMILPLMDNVDMEEEGGGDNQVVTATAQPAVRRRVVTFADTPPAEFAASASSTSTSVGLAASASAQEGGAPNFNLHLDDIGGDDDDGGEGMYFGAAGVDDDYGYDGELGGDDATAANADVASGEGAGGAALPAATAAAAAHAPNRRSGRIAITISGTSSSTDPLSSAVSTAGAASLEQQQQQQLAGNDDEAASPAAPAVPDPWEQLDPDIADADDEKPFKKGRTFMVLRNPRLVASLGPMGAAAAEMSAASSAANKRDARALLSRANALATRAAAMRIAAPFGLSAAAVGSVDGSGPIARRAALARAAVSMALDAGLALGNNSGAAVPLFSGSGTIPALTSTSITGAIPLFAEELGALFEGLEVGGGGTKSSGSNGGGAAGEARRSRAAAAAALAAHPVSAAMGNDGDSGGSTGPSSSSSYGVENYDGDDDDDGGAVIGPQSAAGAGTGAGAFNAHDVSGIGEDYFGAAGMDDYDYGGGGDNDDSGGEFIGMRGRHHGREGGAYAASDPLAWLEDSETEANRVYASSHGGHSSAQHNPTSTFDGGRGGALEAEFRVEGGAEGSGDDAGDFGAVVARYMDRIRNYVDAAASMAQEHAIHKRVAEWQSRLRPVLEAEDERREFDIHAYGIELLEKLNASAASTSPAAAAAPTGELDCDDAAAAAAGAMASSSPHSVSQTASVDFASIFTTERAPAAASADGRSKKHYAGAVASNTAAARHEVCRSFLAMLQLAADGELDILPSSTSAPASSQWREGITEFTTTAPSVPAAFSSSATATFRVRRAAAHSSARTLPPTVTSTTSTAAAPARAVSNKSKMAAAAATSATAPLGVHFLSESFLAPSALRNVQLGFAPDGGFTGSELDATMVMTDVRESEEEAEEGGEGLHFSPAGEREEDLLPVLPATASAPAPHLVPHPQRRALSALKPTTTAGNGRSSGGSITENHAAAAPAASTANSALELLPASAAAGAPRAPLSKKARFAVPEQVASAGVTPPGL